MIGRVILALLLFSFSVFAEETNEFIEVDLVDLYLTATDSKGRFLNDLQQIFLS